MKESKIGVLGLGITGISAVNDLLSKNKSVYVFDEKKSYQEIVKKFPEVNWIDKNTINQIQLVIKSPGIPPSSKIIKMIEKQNIPIVSDIEMAYRSAKTDNIIAVTGTNGKTTTVLAIDYLLKAKDDIINFTAGNIGRGVFDVTSLAEKEDIILLECSSFQLHYTQKFHPKVSVITNITSDHLDWHGNLQDYQDSKKNISKNMNGEDVLILNIDDPVLQEMNRPKCIVEEVSAGQKVSRGIEIISDQFIRKNEEEKYIIGNVNDLKMIGDHNMMNLAAAILAVEPFEIHPKEAFRRLMNFQGGEHRLEFVRNYRDMNFYNDSKGTNPDATDVALQSVKEPIILIAGGYDKQTIFSPLFQKHKNKIKLLVLLGQTSKQMEKEGKEVGINDIVLVDSMADAIEVCIDNGKLGDNVLLSPANASWDMFENYEVRGNVFKKIVNDLEE